jgi:uncharacterized membrane protein YgdD (TMEM256/DUF423 family)
MEKRFLLIGALFGFLTVALGAFGAHALRGTLDDYAYGIFQTAVLYQGLHTAALLATGLLALHWTTPWLTRAGWLFTLGVMLFSGSLYLLALTGTRPLGMITPIGGSLLLLAWLSLGMAIVRATPGNSR